MRKSLQLGQLGRRRVGGFVGPLDAYSTNLWSAASLRRLLSSYTGPSFTGRNTTSSALASIGFNSDGTLDTNAIATLAGANNVVVQAFLSQFGGLGRSYGDGGSSARQPAVWTGGAYLGSIQFDGSTHGLGSGDTSGTVPAFTVFIRGKLRTTTGTQVITEHSTNSGSNDSTAQYYSASALSVSSVKVSTSGRVISDHSGSFPNDNVHCYRIDRAQTTGATQAVLFINGTKQTRSGNADLAPIPTGNFSAQRWHLAARNYTSLYAFLNLHTVLIYEGSLSDSDVSAISTIVAAL